MKPRLQVENLSTGVRAGWLMGDVIPRGRNTRYSHPDCEIWLMGRDSDSVGYIIMCNLQDCNMSVSALRRNRK